MPGRGRGPERPPRFAGARGPQGRLSRGPRAPPARGRRSAAAAPGPAAPRGHACAGTAARERRESARVWRRQACRPGDTRVRMPLSAAQGVGSSTGASRHPRGHPRTGLRGATQTRRRICHESPPACAVRVRALVSVHRCRVLPCERDRRSVPLPPALRCPKHSVTENSTCCISKKLIIFMRSKMAGAKGSKSSPGGTSAVALPLCHIRTAKEEQVGPRRAPSRLLPTHQRACPHPKG